MSQDNFLRFCHFFIPFFVFITSILRTETTDFLSPKAMEKLPTMTFGAILFTKKSFFQLYFQKLKV